MSLFPRPLLAALLLVLSPALLAGPVDRGADPLQPVVGLIIDDMGNRLRDGLRALALPGQVTYAILPQTTYSRQFAELAYGRGKEVMVHQPMQAQNGKVMGSGGLSLHMTRETFVRTLRENLASVPYASGMNNHMGSLLTRHPGQMAWLMEELQQQGGLYFIDSTTTSQTVALRVAKEHQLPSARRNVFLDHDRNITAIERQFDHFLAQAQAVGSALAIAHPYAETLQVLERQLPRLQERGVTLLPVSTLIAQQTERRERLWQASLSPLQKGVKSSKQ